MTRFALGTEPEKKAPTAYWFHNFRIRKLPYEAVIPVPANEMDTYGQRVIDFDPSEPEGYHYQYSGHMYENNIPAAIQTLEAGIKNVARPAEMYPYLTQRYFRTGRYKDAWNICQVAEKYSTTGVNYAYRMMLISCSDDPGLRRSSSAEKSRSSAKVSLKNS